MDRSTSPPADTLVANLLEFALAELVRQHRASFLPLWTRDSWAKLLIWLALTSGCPGDTPALEAFATALGPDRSSRLRRLFFSRELEDEGLRLLADPAEGLVLLQEIDPAPDGDAPGTPSPERVAVALDRVGLSDQVVLDRQRWQQRDGLLTVPFQRCS
jgi:hypothetical protein